MDRLTIIIRQDLPAGAQLAQACHAVAEFGVHHPDGFRAWATNDRNIVCLAAPDEDALAALADAAESLGLACSRFHEPDLAGSLTALALGDGARQLTSCMPLALRALAEPVRSVA